VEQAHATGVDVEGEIEGIKGVEDGVAAQRDGVYSIESAVGFIAATGIDCFAPAIGNAHGMYTSEPALDAERVSRLVALTGVPVALHGGTGLTEAQFRDLTERGCAKVNISTALKRAFIGGYRGFLADHPSASEPLQVMTHVRDAVEDMAQYHISCLGAADRA